MTASTAPLITVITPTTGKPSLDRLRESLRAQKTPYVHLLLWDDVRDEKAGSVSAYEDASTQCLSLKGRMVQGRAAGSALRAVGLMAANTEYVTFADDDVWFDENHLSSLVEAINGKNWAFCLRKIYSPAGEYIGVDRFESVGDAGKLSYQMVDNNTNMFRRAFGVAAAHLYRETRDYNDDRLMYAFLRQFAGESGRTDRATVNQTCPARLEPFFRKNCSAA
jgi:hypothetical protein